MGPSEHRLLEGMRQALCQEGRGLVEPMEKDAGTELSFGRRQGFLDEEQPTLRAATRGAAIGGSIGALASTAATLSKKNPYKPKTQQARATGAMLGAPVGALIGGSMGSAAQRRKKMTARDKRIFDQATIAGAVLGAGGMIKRTGSPTKALLGAGLGAAAGASLSATGMHAARMGGRAATKRPKESGPSLGPVGKTLGLAATGAGAGTYLAGRLAARKVPGAGATQQGAINQLFSRKQMQLAKQQIRGARLKVKAQAPKHFRSMERKGGGIGAAVGAGLALGLLAAESRRRKNRKQTSQ